MFKLTFEKNLGLCRGAQFVPQQRLAFLSGCSYDPPKLTLLGKGFDVEWTMRLGTRCAGLVQTEAHDRLLIGINQPFDRDAAIPCPNQIVEYDEGGTVLLRGDCPFVGIAQISRLPGISAYVISGVCWNLKPRWHEENRTAILLPETGVIRWLPGTAAAWLRAAGKLVWSSTKMAAICDLGADYSLHSPRLIWHDVADIAWLFEIDGLLWAATTTGITCLAAIDAGRAAERHSYEWPQARVGWCRCSDPYIVAARGICSPPFVLDTRTGSIQMLAVDNEPKVKEVFSLDIARENGTVRILTLHRSFDSAKAILRIWEEHKHSGGN